LDTHLGFSPFFDFFVMYLFFFSFFSTLLRSFLFLFIFYLSFLFISFSFFVFLLPLSAACQAVGPRFRALAGARGRRAVVPAS